MGHRKKTAQFLARSSTSQEDFLILRLTFCQDEELPTRRRASPLAAPPPPRVSSGGHQRRWGKRNFFACPVVLSEWRHFAACGVISISCFGRTASCRTPTFRPTDVRGIIEPRNMIRVPRVPPPQRELPWPITVNGKTKVLPCGESER